MSSDEQATNPSGNGRRADGRFAPGNRASVGHGRPSRAREIADFEAAKKAAPPEVLEGLVSKMCELGLGGDVAAARLVFQVRGLLGRDEPTLNAEDVGEGLGELLARPGASDRISALMDAVFERERLDEPQV